MIFSNFPSQSKEDWLKKVEKDLKGKPMETLNWEYQEIPFTPFFHADDLNEQPEPITTGRKSNQWEIGEIIFLNGEAYKEANEQALTALKRGASTLCFQVIETLSLEEMRILLKNIQHEWISTHFICKGKSQKCLVENFIKVVQEKEQNLNEVKCSFQSQLNPLQDLENFEQVLKQLPHCKLLIAADSTTNTAEQLANLLYTANAYLTQLSEHRLDLQKYLHTIQFSFAVSDDYFPSIAKIRALKTLWLQVLEAWNIKANQPLSIEVHLTEQAQSEDENYNKIKATIQALSAVIGGATRLYIYPSDQFKNAGGDNFSRRIALNIQHLLEQESYMNRVTDPAAGSYFIEQLTDALGEAAWDLFRAKN